MANREEISASVDIRATPEQVWALVGDPTRMPEWSPQCRRMIVLGRGPVGVGTRTVNLNRRGPLWWPTRAKIVRYDPPRALAFAIAENRTVWSYELEPTAEGTRLTESRRTPHGVSAVSNLLTRTVLGGTERFEAELEEGIGQTLDRIKAAVEGGVPAAREQVAPLEASIHVAASPEAVWEVLRDQRRMRHWSPETLRQWFYPRRLSHGTVSLNLNRRRWFVWPTISRYVDVVRPARLAFYVYGPAARWSYRLDPHEDGTLLSLRRDLRGGRPSLLSRIVATLALGGVEGHDVELREGMGRTLEAIKREIEQPARR